MFEDFDLQNNQKQEDDDDTETSCYSYPSYSRFTYTGKTKSRLGRNRFMKQTDAKNETKKTDNNINKSSDPQTNSHFLQGNDQAPKTPGVSWLQRDASLSSHPFTPGAKSSNVHGSYSDINSLPTQPNFLFNLRNDSGQNSSCKRNLPFSTTPFKTKAVVPENQNASNPLRELNQISKPENPFSKLDFFNLPKEKNKENNFKSKSENMESKELNPPWNQLKQICDAAIPDLPKVGSLEAVHLRKSNENLKSSIFTPLSIIERKDDDSSNMPLDLSSAESTTNRTIFSRSLMSGSDYVDGDSSSSLNRLSRDTSKETLSKAEDSTAQKTNTDALNGFLPQFLVPKNKNYKTIEDDDSAHSLGTVVERGFDFQPQSNIQKTQNRSQAFNKKTNENHFVEVNQGKDPSPQYRAPLISDLKKSSPSSLPTNITIKDVNPPLQTCNQVQFSNHSKLCQSAEVKLSPPSVPGRMIFPESPSSAPNVPDAKNLVTSVQYHLNNDQSNQNSGSDREVESLVQSMDIKLDAPKSSDGNRGYQIIPGSNVINKQVTEPFRSTNEISDFNQCNSRDPINQLVNSHLKFSNNGIQRNSESSNSQYQSVQSEPKLVTSIATVEKNMNQLPVQQPKPLMMSQGQGEAAHYSKASDNVQPPPSQKTYLAPQLPLNPNSVGDFPHVKPEIPQLAAKPIYSAAKKTSQYKMSVPRGMPSRADTELSVNGKSYTILSMLGKGGSSEVYQVLDPCSSKLLAVKCVDLSMVDKTIADGYLNEIDLLSRLQGCASVIRMFDYEYVQECKMLYVVMEKGDTDLSHLIRDISKTKKISMSMIIYYWTEMLQAVKDIHDQGIIHSDLKPANFLLVSGRLKLIDFGIASSQGDMTSVVKEVTTGTWNYMSPEAIKNTNASGKGFKITYKSDVWSLGCILYNLVYGKTPFSHITNTWGKLSAIADPNHCIEFPDVGAPAVLVKALQSCFHREPKMRPTVAELLSLPYHSTGEGADVTNVGRQVHAILPTQWWLKVAHLFPGVKTSNHEVKH